MRHSRTRVAIILVVAALIVACAGQIILDPILSSPEPEAWWVLVGAV